MARLRFEWLGIVEAAGDLSLPQSVCRTGQARWRSALSGCFALVAAVATSTMVVLVDGHVPKDPICVSDYYPFWKVVCCMGIAGFAASASLIIAVPKFLTRNYLPLVWLVPLLAGIFVFMNWYDWAGLYEYGKAFYSPSLNALRK